MQDCEPSGTFYASLKHLPVIEPVHFFQNFLLQTYGESDHPWKLRDLRFHAVASSLQGWNRHRRIGVNFLTGEELWNIAICPSPAWHLALERARALKVDPQTQVSKSINLSRPRLRRTSVLGQNLETTFKVVKCLCLSKV